MKLGRLNFEFVRGPDRKTIHFWPFDWHFKGMCGCHIFEFFCFAVTWYGDECYAKVDEEK